MFRILEARARLLSCGMGMWFSGSGGFWVCGGGFAAGGVVRFLVCGRPAGMQLLCRRRMILGDFGDGVNTLFQRGFVTARMTMTAMRTAGISLARRKKRGVWGAVPVASVRRQRAQRPWSAKRGRRARSLRGNQAPAGVAVARRGGPRMGGGGLAGGGGLRRGVCFSGGAGSLWAGVLVWARGLGGGTDGRGG